MEGDTVTVACQRLAHLWRGCVVSLYCDNKSFQASAAKGRSKAERLNSLVQELFLLMIKYDFVLHVIWISTHDNVNADALSRVDGEEKFLREVYKPEHACWSPDTVPVRLDGAGRKRTLPEKRGVVDSGEHAGLPAPESKSASEEGGGPAAAPPASLETLIENSRPVEAGDDGTDYIRRAQAAGGCPTAPAAPVAPRRGAGIGIRRGGSLALVLALFGCFCVPGGSGSKVRYITCMGNLKRAVSARLQFSSQDVNGVWGGSPSWGLGREPQRGAGRSPARRKSTILGPKTATFLAPSFI